MRNFINIVEAPLADITTHGVSLDEPGSFNDTDRRYMKRNIIRGVYKKSLKVLKFDLFIYVLNDPTLLDMAEDYPETEITDNFINSLKNSRPDAVPGIEDVLKVIEINRAKDPRAIHFILGDNFSARDQIVPTPWMLIHRLMHAWNQTSAFRSFMVFSNRLKIINKINRFFTFKSAVNDNVRDSSGNTSHEELESEMYTQFYLTGNIPLRNLEMLKAYTDSDEHYEAIVSDFRDYIEKIKKELLVALDANLGKAYYI